MEPIPNLLNALPSLPPDVQRQFAQVPLNQISLEILSDSAQAALRQLLTGDTSRAMAIASSNTVARRELLKGCLFKEPISMINVWRLVDEYTEGNTLTVPTIRVVKDHFFPEQFRVNDQEGYAALLAAEYLGFHFVRIEIVESPEGYEWKCPPTGRLEHCATLPQLNKTQFVISDTETTQINRSRALIVLLRAHFLDPNDVIVINNAQETPLLANTAYTAVSPYEYDRRSSIGNQRPQQPANFVNIIEKRHAHLMQDGKWEIKTPDADRLTISFQHSLSID